MRVLRLGLLFAGAAAVSALTALHAGPVTPLVVPCDGFSGDPPFYGNCSLCHNSFLPNEGDGWLSLDGLPAEYQPGQTYTLTVTLADPGQIRWGFQFVAIDEVGRDAGTVVITDPVHTQQSNVLGRRYMKHTDVGSFFGVADGPVSWELDWVAPAAGSGLVELYLAGNAGNGDDTPFGDQSYMLASSSNEAGGVPREATLMLQPNSINPFRGQEWVVHASAREHLGQSNDLDVVAQVQTLNGNFWPANGFLLPPLAIPLVADGRHQFELRHDVPAGTPLITATYIALLGERPNRLVDQAEFMFTVLP